MKYFFCVIDREYLVCLIVPPTGNEDEVFSQLFHCIDKYDKDTRESTKIFSGDFNHVDKNDFLLQIMISMLSVLTIGAPIFHKMYCNVKDSYRVINMPPFGKAYHDMLFCVLRYKQLLKCEKSTKIQVRGLAEDNKIQLQGCFECPEWWE